MRSRSSLAAGMLALSACGGSGDGNGASAPAPPTVSNRPPAFTSGATASFAENGTGTAYQATANDPDGNPLTFSIVGGADRGRFALTPAGALTFVAAPDFEFRGSAVGTNAYAVQLQVSDGRLSATLDLIVTVTDVSGDGFVLTRVPVTTSQPLFVAAVPGSRDIFVVEKGGRIRRVDPDGGGDSIYLDLRGEVSIDGERGLLGMVASPDFASSGLIYVYLTNRQGDIEIRRYGRNDGFGNSGGTSGDTIVVIPHRQFNNHNGGWLGFGPEGLLYLATGDGGGSGDPLGNAQNLGSLLGKILRIDVRGDGFPGDPNRDYVIPGDNPFVRGFDGAAPEVFAYGLRNPFRNSFDGDTLIIGDVGQDAREEINLLRPQDRGANFGWPFVEGTRAYRGTAPANLFGPVSEYDHGGGAFQGRSITGGYVYRGPILSLRGSYLFGDFVSGNVWTLPFGSLNQGSLFPSASYLRRNGDFFPTGAAQPNVLNQLVSFGEDAARNLYVVDFDGDIFAIRPGD